jgi:hypothetical protein
MALSYNATIRNARLDQITTGAGASAFLRIYDSTRPATGGTATTLLAELTCNATFAPGASGGVLTLNAITQDSSANASGTATWFRIVKSDGTTHVLDGNVGVQVVTTATGSSGAATITVGSNTGLAIGMTASGTGIATGATIVNISGTTITLSINNTGAVSGNGTFGTDLNLTTTTIVITQPVSVTSFVVTEGNA